MTTEIGPVLSLDAAWCVDEILQRYPCVGRTLTAFGVDCGGGGGATLAEAARGAGLVPDELVRALAAVIDRAEPTP